MALEDRHPPETSTVKEIREIQNLTNLKNTVAPNWLSLVDSPTYLWSLYLVNNAIWNDPNLIGNDDAALNNKQAFVIAKQGVEAEFSVDNFMSLATITPGAKHGNATPGIIQFDLFETLGFTFMDRILTAGKNLGKPANLYSQNFILKLEFKGRDPVTSASVPFPGVYLYPVKFNQIRSTTGPEGTRYNIVAWSALRHAQMDGVTDTDHTVENITTVESFYKGFEKEFNDGQKALMAPFDEQRGIAPPKQIEIKFDPLIYQKPGTNIKINGKSLDWFHLPSKSFAGTTDAATSSKTGQGLHNDASDTNTITVERETNIGMWIQKTLSNNCPAWDAWVIEANKFGLTPYIVVEPDPKYPEGTTEENYGNVEPVLIIYTIKIGYDHPTFDASIADGNKKLNDSAHQVERWKTLPIEKSYTYMYTGLNTEVINFQLDVQNLFFVIDQPGSATFVSGKTAEGKQQFTPTKITDSIFLSDIRQSSAELGYFNPVVGGVAKADSAEKSQLNEINLNENSALSRRLQDMAKREYDALNVSIEIKGDPHWMGNMQAVIKGKLERPDYAKQNALITFLQFNPNADKLLTEQVKGEVDPISTGVYKLVTVESRFQGGRFTQTLNGYKDVNSNTALLLPKIIELSGV